MTYHAYLGSLLSSNYLNLIQQGFEFIHLERFVKSDTRIFIKPNLTFPTYRPGVMTNPQAIEAAILAIREYTSHIYIGDSDSGGYNRFSMDQVYQETGIQNFAQDYGVQVVNLSRTDRKQIQFQLSNRLFSLEMPSLLLDEIDLLITMPVPKIHNNTGVSLTFKNQWGCIPEPSDRLRLHPYFKQVIIEVNKAIKATVAIIDGKYGLNKNGPLRGIATELNWILISDHIGAGARLALELMRIPLHRIPHLQYAQKLGWIPELNEIQINCALTPFYTEKFYLKREWTDYPGWLAFHHPFLAYLAYFSPVANLLHKLLYLFREPFYDYQKYSSQNK